MLLSLLYLHLPPLINPDLLKPYITDHGFPKVEFQ